MIRKIGLPSPVFCAPVEISMPLTSRPRRLRWPSVSGRTATGTASRAASSRARSRAGAGSSRGRSAGSRLAGRARAARRGARCGAPARRGPRPARGSGSPPRAAARVGAAVQQHLDGVGVAVLGEIEAEPLQPPPVRAPRRRPRRRPRCGAPVLRDAVKRIETCALARVAAEAAGLDVSRSPRRTKPDASSLPPNDAEPATSRPRRPKTPRSQSPARAQPDADEPARGRSAEQVAARRRRRDVAVA